MPRTSKPLNVSYRNTAKSNSYFPRLMRDLRKNLDAYLLIIPAVIIYLLFAYKPMYGVINAFKDFSPAAGILGSDWADNFGMQNFMEL
jgi:ABC-type polysaccharide transport system permease subunit